MAANHFIVTNAHTLLRQQHRTAAQQYVPAGMGLRSVWGWGWGWGWVGLGSVELTTGTNIHQGEFLARATLPGMFLFRVFFTGKRINQDQIWLVMFCCVSRVLTALVFRYGLCPSNQTPLAWEKNDTTKHQTLDVCCSFFSGICWLVGLELSRSIQPREIV